MRKLQTFGLHERARAGMLKELLEQEGIACLLRNEPLGSALGEIPFTECFPELWIIDDEAWPRARRLLDGWLQPAETASPWCCPGCGETLEGQFGACWNCGRPRPR